jgi:hypothetical protein
MSCQQMSEPILLSLQLVRKPENAKNNPSSYAPLVDQCKCKTHPSHERFVVSYRVPPLDPEGPARLKTRTTKRLLRKLFSLLQDLTRLINAAELYICNRVKDMLSQHHTSKCVPPTICSSCALDFMIPLILLAILGSMSSRLSQSSSCVPRTSSISSSSIRA